MSKYELSIAEDYVASWGIVEAVREFFQNSLDQQTVNPDNEMFFEYDEDTQTLMIGNKNSFLETKTLLLGVSTKKDDNSTIGQFGEGYKIATLVALREGKEVVIYNYGNKEVWRPRMVNSRRYQAKVLTFFTEKYLLRRVPNYDLIIEIRGITSQEFQRIKTHNLHLIDDLGEFYEAEEGRILLDARFKGQLFVNGLFVKELKELKCGYDIQAKYLPLDRDRKAVSSFDTQWVTSRMWAQAPVKQALSMVREQVPDVTYLASVSSYMRSNLFDEAVISFREKYGLTAVPVENQTQMEQVQAGYDNAIPVIVSHTEQQLIYGSTLFKLSDFQKKTLTQEQKLKLWILAVMKSLSFAETKEFYTIMGWTEEEAEKQYFK